MSCLHPVLPAYLPVVPIVSQSHLCVQAWLVFFFPPHFFFHFLYYTDVGSVTFVVAAYLVSSTSANVFVRYTATLLSHCTLQLLPSCCHLYLESSFCFTALLTLFTPVACYGASVHYLQPGQHYCAALIWQLSQCKGQGAGGGGMELGSGGWVTHLGLTCFLSMHQSVQISFVAFSVPAWVFIPVAGPAIDSYVAASLL